MTSFEQLVYEAETAANLDASVDQDGAVAELLIQHYRADLRNVMLIPITAFGATDEYTEAVHNLARDLGISNSEASKLLWPMTRVIYRAAEGVDIGMSAPRDDNDESNRQSTTVLEPPAGGRFTR